MTINLGKPRMSFAFFSNTTSKIVHLNISSNIDSLRTEYFFHDCNIEKVYINNISKIYSDWSDKHFAKGSVYPQQIIISNNSVYENVSELVLVDYVCNELQDGSYNCLKK